MKAKVDQFIPPTYCKRMGFCPIELQANNPEVNISLEFNK
jgi:hypothetical protein